MSKDEIQVEAMSLYRIVQGKGDARSDHSYYAQNPALIEGWERLARHVLRRIEKAGEPQYGNRLEDC